MAKTTIPAGYFAAGSIATADIAANAITSAKLAQNSVLTKHIDDNQVGIDQLNVSDGSNGQVLTTNGSGTLSFSTVTGTTINNNADNRVITGSGTANTLEGESNFVFDNSTSRVGIGTTSPTHGLTVSDEAVDASASRRITIKGTNHGANAGYRFTLEDSGGNTRAGGYYFQPATSNDASYLSLSANDNDGHLNVLGSGDVGIGTATPFGTTSNRTCLTVNGTNDVSLNIGQGGTQRGYFYCSSSLARISSYGTISLELGTNDTKRLELTSAGHLLPAANNSYDLGSATLGFRNIYTNDLNLSNMAPTGTDSEGNAYTRPGNDVDGTNGSWTIQEGADDLFIINRTNGKKYRFNLTEVTD